ncbi:MAG TPA: hypothetical protein DDX39_08835 [Bacteroidales bacterium]|nr:MAG: hypothetical protein A2W98_11955 [Bacteroidetes bacterium GWF2_33_38]OFY74695.1 MAG: hypothetical protein A2265_01515 [Bacteroidetes bacterium RIFOXYA12_FULL_33_9]OFY89896.1 MAG: hypothetical protein A2236_07985 [Bacteroidetes bacterium RIFOXYA2_FULL_33_7]HBF88732.1 hypothetical protein [Bacteroidales bacterium]
MKLFALVFILISFIVSTNDSLIQTEKKPDSDTLKYIFISHLYQWYSGGKKVDLRVEQLNLSSYSGIWLGGDVCSEAAQSFTTLEYIDNLFDLSNTLTLWTLGNHDTRNFNMEWISEFTNKNSYYTTHSNGITYIVLNTNFVPYDCENIDNQYRLLTNVCDTISTSSHLIILMHHGIISNVSGVPQPDTYAHTNYSYWNANCYSADSNFANTIYPKLVKVKQKGIDVICIVGDMGSLHKTIELTSPDSIKILGCGLNNSYFLDSVELSQADKDKVLIFKHIPEIRKLFWNFCDLDSLLESQN